MPLAESIICTRYHVAQAEAHYANGDHEKAAEVLATLCVLLAETLEVGTKHLQPEKPEFEDPENPDDGH